MRKNESGSVSFMMLDAAGDPVESGWAGVFITLDNGTQFTGSGSIEHKGNGEWTYEAFNNETNAIHASYTMYVSGAIRQTINTYPQPFTNNYLDTNMSSVSGDFNSAYNLKNMYNGTGYTHDTAPSSRSQINDLDTDLIWISGSIEDVPSGVFSSLIDNYDESGTFGRLFNDVSEDITELDYDNYIWVDPINGTDAAVFGVHGTKSNPCKTWSNASSLLTTSSFTKIRVINRGNLEIASSPPTSTTVELDPICTLTFNIGGVNLNASLTVIGGSVANINNASMGISAHLKIKNCGSVSGAPSGGGTNQLIIENCGIFSNITSSGFGITQISNCYSRHSTSGWPTISITAGHGSINDWHGGITLNPTGTGHIHFTGTSADMIITGSSGSVELVGPILYTDSSGGAVTIDDDGITALEKTLGTPTDTDISADIANLQTDTTYISGQMDVVYNEFDDIPSGIFTHNHTNYTTSGTLGGFLYRSNDIDGLSLQESLRIIGAICAGKVSGAGTSTEVFTGLDGSTTRVTVTPDVSGNRIDVVYG